VADSGGNQVGFAWTIFYRKSLFFHESFLHDLRLFHGDVFSFERRASFSQGSLPAFGNPNPGFWVDHDPNAALCLCAGRWSETVGFPIDVGHLWFLEHLLIFSAGYVLWQTLRGNRVKPEPGQGNPPGYLTVLMVALFLAIVTGVVRIWYPIDKWVYLLGFIRVAFADVPRDLGFFIIGVLAYDRQWFQRFPLKNGYIWLGIGLALAVCWYAYNLALWKLLPTSGIVMDIIRLLWEMLLCFGMCIGLTVLFREKFNFQGRIGKAMSQGQYGAYIFHVLFVLLFQFVVIGLPISPFAKFILVTLAAVPSTFLFSYWVKKPLHL